MADHTNLTDNEKLEIVKGYKKKFNTAIAIKISAFLILGLLALIKEFFNVKLNTIYALITVPAVIFFLGAAIQYQLLKCPVCSKKYPYTAKTYPMRCPNCGIFLGDKIDAVNEHIRQQE